MGLNMEYEIQKTRMALMRLSPFYGSLLLNIPILRDDREQTACTDGRRILYNAGFMESLKETERRFVLMHELFHILLMHPSRFNGRDPRLYNVAADLIVNFMCQKLAAQPRFRTGFPMSMLPGCLYATLPADCSMEELYAKLLDDQLKKAKGLSKGVGGTILLRGAYMVTPWNKSRQELQEQHVPASGERGQDGRRMLGASDLREANLTPQEAAALEQHLRELVRQAAKGDPGMGPSLFLPREILALGQRKPLPWKRLLRDFLTEERDDDASYATPERKYIHMDLILPGHGLTEGGVSEVWAFVDSSGSISGPEMEAFLSELYHLIKGLHCTLHIAYWDTSVTDVYRGVNTVKKLKESKPKHSGGTNINCVYQWIYENRVKPDVMLILTDGAFGTLRPEFRKNRLRKKTILVLSNEHMNHPDMREIGRVAVLGGK